MTRDLATDDLSHAARLAAARGSIRAKRVFPWNVDRLARRPTPAGLDVAVAENRFMKTAISR